VVLLAWFFGQGLWPKIETHHFTTRKAIPTQEEDKMQITASYLVLRICLAVMVLFVKRGKSAFGDAKPWQEPR